MTKLHSTSHLEQIYWEQSALRNFAHQRADLSNLLLKQNTLFLIMATLVIAWVMIEPTFGVTVQSLQAPIQTLKSTLFGGWMWIAKIGAAVGGCVMAVYQRDIIPLATGAAVGLGIHFYDGYFGDVTQAALI